MNKKEALNYIYNNPYIKKKPGLENITKVLEYLGNPQDKLSFIHVAGTNGKGSCVAMLHSILNKADYKVGMFTSPHLISPKERFIINGKCISDKDFVTCAEIVLEATNKTKVKLNVFEKITAIGFVYFEKKKCDVVVLEVGLGGRYDATNVIKKPLVSVLMNIGLDHTDVIGDTLEKIAYEKAGIIKDNCPVVSYDNKKSVIKVFKNEAKLKNTTIKIADFKKIEIIKEGKLPQSFNYKEYKNIKISLLGRHQFYNASTVLEVVGVLKTKGYKISLKNIKDGLMETEWLCRLSILNKKPLFILDGGHNPQCANALASSLPSIIGNKKVIILCGMLHDKDYKEVMDIMMPFAKLMICVTPNSNRALNALDLADYLNSKGMKAIAAKTIDEGILLSLDLAKNSPIVAFGSLYLAGDIVDKFDKVYQKYVG